tara:strand:- start:75 stop:1052 length:978 start_codon:yes stop_codon:yes gene_type:complete
MYLRKRNGKWICEVSLRGQRYSKSFLLKSEGHAWGTKKEKEIYEGMNVETLSKNTLGDVITKYKTNSLSGIKDNTRRAYLDQIRKLERDYKWLLQIKLRDLTPEHFEKFKAKRLKDVGGNHSKNNHRAVNNDLGLFGRVLNTACTIWHYPIQNYASKIKKLPETRGKRIEETLTKDVYKKLLRHGTDRYFHLCLMILKHTGLRPIEVHNLKWKDFDDYRLKLYIRNPKNNRPREVDISRFLSNQISKVSKTNGEFIINFSQNAMKKRMQRLKAIYNLGEFELYDFRRYRTQRLINANKYNIGYVAKQIGHSDWNMLGRYYGAQVR